MKRKLKAAAATLLFLAFASGVFAGHKEKNKVQSIVVKYDAPMATTFYKPDGVPTVRTTDRIHFKIYPYIGHKADGKTWFRLVIGIPFLPNASPELREARLTVDGADSYTMSYMTSTVKDDGVFMKLFDRGGDDLEPIIRRVATAKDVWLIVVTPPSGSSNRSYTRINLHLTPDQIETFRMMVEKFDSLKTEPKIAPERAIPAAAAPAPAETPQAPAATQPATTQATATPAPAQTPAQAPDPALSNMSPQQESLGDVARKLKAQKAAKKQQPPPNDKP